MHCASLYNSFLFTLHGKLNGNYISGTPPFLFSEGFFSPWGCWYREVKEVRIARERKRGSWPIVVVVVTGHCKLDVVSTVSVAWLVLKTVGTSHPLPANPRQAEPVLLHNSALLISDHLSYAWMYIHCFLPRLYYSLIIDSKPGSFRKSCIFFPVSCESWLDLQRVDKYQELVVI